MPSINKHAVPGFVARFLSSQLTPIKILIDLAGDAAMTDNVAFQNGRSEFYFADLIREVMIHRSVPINRQSLKKLGDEIITAANGKVRGSGWMGSQELEPFLTKIFQKTLEREMYQETIITYT